MAELQDQPDSVAELAQLRGESIAKTNQFLDRLARRLIPGRMVDPSIFDNLEFAETGLDWPYAFARMKNGKIFYSWPSNPSRLRQFWLIRDKLPKVINANTFGVATDVATRYAFRTSQQFPRGGAVIEGGAYIGFKAIRYAEEVGPSGKVIAVEMDRANHDLMCLNIEVNGFDAITPVHAAISPHDGTIEMNSGGRQRNSISETVGIRNTSRKTVPAITIDSLIETHNLATVDFLNLQINGAEGEALAACVRHAGSIQRIHVANYESLGGATARAQVISWLERNGFSISQSPASITGAR